MSISGRPYRLPRCGTGAAGGARDGIRSAAAESSVTGIMFRSPPSNRPRSRTTCRNTSRNRDRPQPIPAAPARTLLFEYPFGVMGESAGGRTVVSNGRRWDAAGAGRTPRRELHRQARANVGSAPQECGAPLNPIVIGESLPGKVHPRWHGRWARARCRDATTGRASDQQRDSAGSRNLGTIPRFSRAFYEAACTS